MSSNDFDETLPIAPPRPQGEIPRDMECFGGYRLIRVLGRGGMGVVYEAEQLSLKRRVALKMLHSIMDRELLLRFLAEAELSAALHHSNIVHIYEINQHDGTPYFGMEYVDGGTLAQRLESGPLPPREAAALLIPIAKAVHFAHTKNVVHRDLKPGNILLDQQGVPKVADFGIAKRLDDESMLTQTGAVMGTPCYMAPEQASGASQEASPSADIYSLGVILYEMLIGQPPFLPKVGEKPVGWRVVHEDPIPITKLRRELSRDLEAICLLCLRKSMRERYATAEDLAADLQRYLDGEPVKAKPPSLYRRTVAWARRHPTAAAVRAALVVAVAAGLLWARHWVLYQRPHVEYAANVEITGKGITVPRPLTDDQAKHAAIFLRLTRQGLAGPVVSVEAINSKGRPATARDILQYDLLGNLLQANAGMTDPSARGREVTRVDVTYANERPSLLTQWDRNHQKILSVEFHPQEDGQGAVHAARLRFVDERSFDFTTRNGASEADVVLDDQGRNIATRFYDSLGRRARNGDGLFGYLIRRDSAGHESQVTYIDENDQPMSRQDGVYQYRISWSAQGDPEGVRFYDASGTPIAASNGVASVAVTYDGARNIVSMRRYDVKGQPKDGTGAFLDTFFNWAVIEYHRDAEGQLVGFTPHRASDQSPPLIVERAALKYDDNGYLSKCETWGPGGKEVTKLQQRWDSVGNRLEYHFEYPPAKAFEWKRYNFDARGNSILQEELNASGALEGRTNVEYQEDRPVRETYYDAKGQPRRIGTGYSQLEYRYNEKKYVVEKRYTGYDLPQSKVKAFLQHFDEQGRLDHATWLDGEGQLTNGPFHWAERLQGYYGSGWASLFDKYKDAAGHPVQGPGGYASSQSKYNAAGVKTEEIVEGVDADKLGYSIRHELVDAKGRVMDERFFDASGGKAWCHVGYHHRVSHEFSPSDMATKSTFEDYDPKRYKFFRKQEEKTFEGKRLLSSRMTFEDEAGKPVYGPDPCLVEERRYDTQGREVLRIQTGWDSKRWGAPVWKTETEWGSDGHIQEATEQAFDDQGHLLSEGNATWGARREVVFEDGKPRHEVTTGLPEKEVGASRRERDFDESGKEVTAVHYFYSDGKPAKLEVVVVSIDANAQPSSAKFAPEDVLISRNGQPVTSLEQMGAGLPFEGGWVEVRRAGKTICIDGFEPGMMGVKLKEKIVPRL